MRWCFLNIGLMIISKTRKDTIKSCIEAVAYIIIIMQSSNFLVRLLFKCGFYLRVAYMQNLESANP